MTRTGRPRQHETVHWTGLHRLLDSTTVMVSMTRTERLRQNERGPTEQRESKRIRIRVGVGVRVRVRLAVCSFGFTFTEQLLSACGVRER